LAKKPIKIAVQIDALTTLSGGRSEQTYLILFYFIKFKCFLPTSADLGALYGGTIFTP